MLYLWNWHKYCVNETATSEHHRRRWLSFDELIDSHIHVFAFILRIDLPRICTGTNTSLWNETYSCSQFLYAFIYCWKRLFWSGRTQWRGRHVSSVTYLFNGRKELTATHTSFSSWNMGPWYHDNTSPDASWKLHPFRHAFTNRPCWVVCDCAGLRNGLHWNASRTSYGVHDASAALPRHYKGRHSWKEWDRKGAGAGHALSQLHQADGIV